MEEFAGVRPYELRGVQVADTVIGHGSYATVHELRYMGLKCAGKKIHKELSRTASYSVHRFVEECHLLSRVRHPNIVQFLGVHFQEGEQIPILVMEFLPSNLTSSIERRGILPKEISYSILHDVALALFYLHSQTPPIIHRDLSSNNVLLTANMAAKISDLGMARIINLSPLQASHMTQTPGTPHFMPPEVMTPNPQYDTAIDTFSYGVVMIHMFSGKWPEPQTGQTRIEAGKLIPVTEAERREVFLREIENDHPLMDLVHKLINNDPQVRPGAGEILERLIAIVSKLPSSSSNDMLEMPRNDRFSYSHHTCTRDLTTSEEVASSSAQQIEDRHFKLLLRNSTTKLEILEKERKAFEQEKLSARSEIASLSKQVAKLQATLKSTVGKFEENLAKAQGRYKEKVSSEFKQKLEEEKQVYERSLKQERTKYDHLLQEHEQMLACEKRRTEEKSRLCDQLEVSNSKLEAETVASAAKIESLKTSNLSLEEKVEAIKSAISIKESEIEVRNKALEEKEATISEMSELLTRTRQCLRSNPQPLQAALQWNKCADMPIAMCNGRTEVINGKVYFRGMTLADDDDDDDNILLCYDVVRDSWTALPPLPVKWFGLGQVDGKLVAVGGLKKDDKATNNVYTLNIVQKWKPTLPHMPTARCLVAVLTLSTGLVVAGGLTGGQLGKEKETDAVEIFNFSLSQWYKASSLPRPCSEISLMGADDACYILGGYQYPFRLNQALCASINDLFRPADSHPLTPTGTGCSTTQSNTCVWRKLLDTPTFRPAGAVVAGSLFAIGGGAASIGEADKRDVCMYSPSSQSWIYVGDLPAPRSRTIAAILSSTEILVIGGVEYGERVSTVYKGTLKIV